MSTASGQIGWYHFTCFACPRSIRLMVHDPSPNDVGANLLARKDHFLADVVDFSDKQCVPSPAETQRPSDSTIQAYPTLDLSSIMLSQVMANYNYFVGADVGIGSTKQRQNVCGGRG